MAIDVLLVEDNRLMFEGLSSLLADYADLHVVGVATTVADAVEKALVLKPDLVLMNSRLPDGDGAQACERVLAKVPDAAVLFLSANTSEASIIRAIEAGASGYVSKSATADELLAAIKTAAVGELLLDTAVMAKMHGLRRRPSLPPSGGVPAQHQLTTDEKDVLGLLADGLDNERIAGELGMDRGRVRGLVRGVLEKLGVHSRVLAVAAAKEAGLLESLADHRPSTAEGVGR